MVKPSRETVDGFSRKRRQSGGKADWQARKESLERGKEKMARKEGYAVNFGKDVIVRSWAVPNVCWIFWLCKRPESFPTRPSLPFEFTFEHNFKDRKGAWRLFSVAPKNWLIGASDIFKHLSLMQLLFSAVCLSVNRFNSSCTTNRNINLLNLWISYTVVYFRWWYFSLGGWKN